MNEMKKKEYYNHKILITSSYRKKMQALKEMYPEEWEKDHAPKGASSTSKGVSRSGHRVGANL